MTFKKTNLQSVFSVLMILFVIAYLYSPRLKSWVIMGFMMVGFFKPHIPEVKPGEKLEQMPHLVVQSMDGKTIDLQQQKGKVIFINIWATWCPPCLAELPSVNDFYLRIKNNPNVIFISADADNKLNVSSLFLQKKGYGFPLYSGNLETLPQQIYSGTIPTTLVVDKKGFVVFNHINRANYNDDAFVKYVHDLSRQ
jgi:thiol-disulfide isomerase/thioredoxin